MFAVTGNPLIDALLFVAVLLVVLYVIVLIVRKF